MRQFPLLVPWERLGSCSPVLHDQSRQHDGTRCLVCSPTYIARLTSMEDKSRARRLPVHHPVTTFGRGIPRFFQAARQIAARPKNTPGTSSHGCLQKISFQRKHTHGCIQSKDRCLPHELLRPPSVATVRMAKRQGP